jgi:hypothetical protein
MTSDRRDFLHAMLAAALPLHEWLGAFGVQSEQEPQEPRPAKPAPRAREQHLRDAAAKAKEHGKPLMVFVVPDDATQARARGTWLGSWIVIGGERARLDLATTVPAAASAAEIAAVCRVTLPSPPPPIVLIDPTNVADAGKPVASTNVEFVLGGDWPQTVAALEPLTLAVAGALARQAGGVDELARRAHARLADDHKQQLAEWLGGGGPPSSELIVRAAACVRCRAADLPDNRRGLVLASLNAAIERELVQRRVPGTKWAQGHGCGHDVENPDTAEERGNGGIECGRGHVPAPCRRFLLFYTKS